MEKNDVAVFSSNYHLYGDMSMAGNGNVTNDDRKDNVEVYSVDEAFLDLSKYSVRTII